MPGPEEIRRQRQQNGGEALPDQVQRRRSASIHQAGRSRTGNPPPQQRQRRNSLNRRTTLNIPANPIMQNTVDGVKTSMEAYDLVVPTEIVVQSAYQSIGVRFADLERSRKSRLKESGERYNLQRKLRNKETRQAQNGAPAVQRAVSHEKAFKLKDSDLVEHLGEYRDSDPQAQYLTYRYSIMRNKYYSSLPAAELKGLSIAVLMQRLKKLYEEPQGSRDKDLIAFLQDIITVKRIEEDEERAGNQQANAVPGPMTAEERRHNAKALKENRDYINSLSHLDPQTKAARIQAMNEVLNPPQDEVYKQNNGHLNLPQKDGLRTVLAWMYRNCNKSSESKESFVFKLTQAAPEKVLYMFYILENGTQSAPNAELFYSAANTYVPNVDNIKKHLIASKAKFWRRIGSDASDNVIDWSKIGQAARFALNCDVITDYYEYEDKAKEEKEKYRANQANPSRAIEPLLKLLINEGNMMLTLYKAAGLSADMPPRLIHDSQMRERVLSLNRSFARNVDLLRTLRSSYRGGYGGDQDPHEQGQNAGAPVAMKAKERGTKEAVDDYNTTTTAVLNVDTLFKVIGEKMDPLLKNDYYSFSKTGVSFVSNLVGFITTTINAANLMNSASNLTGADHAAKALNITGSMFKHTGGMIQGAGTITSRFVDTASASTTGWIGNTSIRSASKAFSSVAGGTQFVAGIATMASGAFMTTAGLVEIGRSVSSRNDVARSEKRIADIQRDGGVLTEDQKKLVNLNRHMNRKITDQEFSGTVKAIGGVLAMAGGFMTTTGILAPIGGIIAITGSLINIGLGVLYARHRRKVTQRKAADDGLKLDEAVAMIRQARPELANLKPKEVEKLKDQVRQEALAELGYATYKEFYADLSRQNAMLLYKHVFEMPEGTDDYKMFLDTLKSLGLKIEKSQDNSKPNIPTPQMIFSKLME